MSLSCLQKHHVLPLAAQENIWWLGHVIGPSSRSLRRTDSIQNLYNYSKPLFNDLEQNYIVPSCQTCFVDNKVSVFLFHISYSTHFLKKIISGGFERHFWVEKLVLTRKSQSELCALQYTTVVLEPQTAINIIVVSFQGKC